MENKNYQEDLLHIRKMMEKKLFRFISLERNFKRFAGLFALAGAIYVYFFSKNGVKLFQKER